MTVSGSKRSHPSSDRNSPLILESQSVHDFSLETNASRKSPTFSSESSHHSLTRPRRRNIGNSKERKKRKIVSTNSTKSKKKRRALSVVNPNLTKGREVVKRKRKERFKSRDDPIMLTPLCPEPFYWFTFTRPNGTTTTYDVRTLAKYLMVSGEFREPVTRIPFSKSDLEQIDTQLKKVVKHYTNRPLTRSYVNAQDDSIEKWLSKRALVADQETKEEEEKKCKTCSVVDAFEHPERYSEARCRRDALLGLERCLSGTVEDMMHIVEGSVDPEYAEIRLLTDIFPQFHDYFSQLHSADASMAYSNLEHYINLLKGNERQPFPDPFGFKAPIIAFLKDHRS